MSPGDRGAKIYGFRERGPLDPDEVQRREEAQSQKARDEGEKRFLERKKVCERNIHIFLQRFPLMMRGVIQRLESIADRYQQLTAHSSGFNPGRYREFQEAGPDVRSWPAGERAMYADIMRVEGMGQKAWLKLNAERTNWENTFYNFGEEEESAPDLVVLQATMRRYAEALKLPKSFRSIHPGEYQKLLMLLRAFEAKLKRVIAS